MIFIVGSAITVLLVVAGWYFWGWLAAMLLWAAALILLVGAMLTSRR